MNFDILLIVFIGLVTVSMVSIAVSLGVVAWYAVIALKEFNTVMMRIHSAGEAVAADIAEVRSYATGQTTKIFRVVTTVLNVFRKGKVRKLQKTHRSQKDSEDTNRA